MKPTGENDDDREIVISGWKSYEKNTLKGFFSITMRSGLILHDLTLHRKNGTRWIGFPGREWVN